MTRDDLEAGRQVELDALPTVPVTCQCSRCRSGRSHEELPARIQWASRIIRNGVLRHLEAGEFAGPEDLSQLADLAQLAQDALGQAVRAMRLTHGYSWTDVGRALGTSRQAAQERFARYCKEDIQP